MSNTQNNTKNRNSYRKPTRKHSDKTPLGKWASYLEQKDWMHFRYQMVAFVFVCVFVILWLRAAYLQVIIGSELRAQSDKQHSITQLVAAKRGNIYDRNGQVLARSVEVRSIYAHPRQIKDPQLAAKTLAPILKMEEARLLKQLQQDRSFVWISRKVDDATSLAISRAKLPGIGLSSEFERVYPFKHLAGQLLGFVGIDNDGLEGIERAFNETLNGESQRFVIPRDIAGRALYSIDDKETVGEDITLSLDVQIQFIAEEIIAKAVTEYEAKWGGVLIADPRTGDILAWAQYPFFNPNNFKNYSPTIYRNRLANDALEPGSTFKPLIVAAALEEKIITKDSTFSGENGVWTLDHIKIGRSKKPFTIGDDGRAYKELNIEEIIKFSSNIGMAKITQLMGGEKLTYYLNRLGFGRSTGIGINEAKGIVRKGNNYSEADILSTGFGQSLSVTGVQLLQAYNFLVNDGQKIPIKLIKDKEHNVIEQNVFSKKNARDVLAMMESVVSAKGTGRRAIVEGVRVAGKTGTAQKAAKNSVGYGEERMASFVGILPIDDPRYLIITILDEPQTQTYGGVIAAPVFQEIATRTMAYNGELPAVTFASDKDVIADGANNKKPQPIKVKKGIVPDVTNLSLRSAIEAYQSLGIIPKVVGQGTYVVMQVPPKGTPIVDENALMQATQAPQADQIAQTTEQAQLNATLPQVSEQVNQVNSQTSGQPNNNQNQLNTQTIQNQLLTNNTPRGKQEYILYLSLPPSMINTVEQEQNAGQNQPTNPLNAPTTSNGQASISDNGQLSFSDTSDQSTSKV